MTMIACGCGSVLLEACGPAMLSAICHCTSCRTAGFAFDSVSRQRPVVDPFGGTAVILWRKDRVRCAVGSELLQSQRLIPTSPTRRMVPSCCSTPLFADSTKGFWLTVFANTVHETVKPTMRIMTRDTPADTILPREAIPHFQGYPGRFMTKLILNRALMGFKKPIMASVAPD